MRANGGGADMTTTSDADTAEPERPRRQPDETAGLATTVRRAKSAEVSPQDVFDAFIHARVYCERPEEPGFLTVTEPEPPAAGAPPRSRILDLATTTDTGPSPALLVPVFTSLEQFELFTGGGAWFSTTGADLLDLLPPGLDVWLDPAAEHAVRLASAATAVEPVLHVSYRSRGGTA
ncbi:SseB family protein [Streptomyces sp. WAC 04229]|uniref:SseB family protein n=1 Tax=Streptomyces sp. WAC 04229 TaxID=2203206 RepID=UPI003D75D664